MTILKVIYQSYVWPILIAFLCMLVLIVLTRRPTNLASVSRLPARPLWRDELPHDVPSGE